MKLEIAMLVGPEAKQFLADLTKQIDRMEKCSGSIADNEDIASDDSEDFEEKPAKKAAKKSKDEDENQQEFGFDDADEEPEEKSAKKAAKTPKLTINDVNDACKEYARENGVKATKALLMKKFKSDSVSEIDPSKYQAVIDVMRG